MANAARRTTCTIQVLGELEPDWSAWFDGFEVRPGADGTTMLSGPVADQAGLYGLLARVRDLGLPLRAVKVIETDGAGAPASPSVED